MEAKLSIISILDDYHKKMIFEYKMVEQKNEHDTLLIFNWSNS